jgi:hypothetical protein
LNTASAIALNNPLRITMMVAVALGQGLSFLWLILLASESEAVRGGVDRELAVRGKMVLSYVLDLAICQQIRIVSYRYHDVGMPFQLGLLVVVLPEMEGIHMLKYP